MNAKIENLLEAKLREIEYCDDPGTQKYQDLYKDIANDRLRYLFSWLHAAYINSFSLLNKRLPTRTEPAHFWAASSRELLSVIRTTLSLQESLADSELAFNIDNYYDGLIKKCLEFLSESCGSTIPIGVERVELYYLMPIFHLADTIKLNRGKISIVALKPIGEGSYAKVFRYTDEVYRKDFALKRANSDLDDKGFQRFKREFDEMKRLHSPYVVEVYVYDEQRREYTMELLDCTLENYMNRYNAEMTLAERKSLVLQLIRAYRYLYSKNVLHRDVSPRNVLLKQYDDVTIVKLSDFGLVKIVDSVLTSENTEVRGSLNDPALKIEGFGNYTLHHELYAITLLIAYVLTGKSNVAKITDSDIRSFITKGTDPDKTKRFQTFEELRDAINKLFEKLKVKQDTLSE